MEDKCSNCGKATTGYRSNLITGKRDAYCEECWNNDNPYWVIPLFLLSLMMVALIIAIIIS